MDNIVKVVNLKKIFLKISASSKVVGRQGVPKEKKKKKRKRQNKEEVWIPGGLCQGRQLQKSHSLTHSFICALINPLSIHSLHPYTKCLLNSRLAWACNSLSFICKERSTLPTEGEPICEHLTKHPDCLQVPSFKENGGHHSCFPGGVHRSQATNGKRP